jgi:predicted SprT family Zn-dependent metalloprotease
MSAQYTAEGGWLSTTTYIELTDIPENVQKVLSRKFPEYDVYDVSRVETAGGRYFEAMLESEEDALLIQVNEDGGILKKEAIAIDLE